MLFWALIFLVLAVAAGVLGFGSVGSGVGAFTQAIVFIALLFALAAGAARGVRALRGRGRDDHADGE